MQGPWKEYTHHDFVARMGDGTLPVENFKYYLIQDYLFLVSWQTYVDIVTVAHARQIQFARANALASYKSKSIADIGRSARQIVHIQEEMKLHIEVCKEYGLSVKDIECQEEDQGTASPKPYYSKPTKIRTACTAYTRYIFQSNLVGVHLTNKAPRYVLDIGQSEDSLALEIALFPCLLGYGRIARRLYEDSQTVKNSRYWKWIETYVAEDYCEAMRAGIGKLRGLWISKSLTETTEMIEEAATRQSVSRIDELAKIFVHATKVSEFGE